MPINDSSSVYPEKLIKSTTTVASAPKSNAQLELQMLLNPSSSSAKIGDNSLIKHQGQKWQQFFDFDKMLKQIRIAEKQNFRSKSDHSTGGSSSSSNSNNNNGKSSTQSIVNAVSPPKTSSLKCSRQLKQVQRLSGGDMHYYGIVPKQTAIGVVVCNVCRGIYTRVGFNNHMMLQHPSVWSTISTKISNPATSLVDSCSNLIANDNSQDSIRPDSVTNVAAADVVLGSPSDLSGTMSTCSNASSTSSSLSSVATYATAAAISATPTPTPRHHKSSKNSSSAGGSSSGSNGSRSRSKSSKHHQSSSSNSGGVHASSSSTSSSMSTTGAASAEVPQISSKTAKKSSNTNASANVITTTPVTVSSAITTTSVAAPPTLSSIGGASNTTAITATISSTTTSADTHTQPITIYSSSSSNSSCSLPPTPKMVATSTVPDVCTLSAPLEKNAFSPASLISINDAKDKTSTDTSASLTFIASSKKKSKSPSFIGQESVDSSTSNSSSEYERASSSGTNTSSKSVNAATFASNAKTNNTPVAIKPPMCGKDLKRFSDTHISELDQAVSSITGGAPDTKNGITSSMCMEGIESNLGADTTFKMHQPAAMDGIVVPTTTAASGSLITAIYQQQEMSQSCDEPMPHNTSDDNSILTLEEMLDSKFINEILNTADSEIHFDENELDATTQQQATYSQQPAAKRMRFDESVTNGSIGNQQTEISGEFAVFQQQQQQMLQQQQYAHYDAENLEDIKVYNAEQLQQLLYQQQQQQQQNLNGYGNVDGIDGSAVSAAFDQQEQFGPNGSIVNVNAKQIIDLCAEEDLQKSKNILQGNLADYTAMTPMNVDEYENSASNALAAQFHILNVPSLTDDNTEEEGNIVMPSIVDNGRTGVGATQQYVLPGSEDHLIYEITANNQVAVMSQQRQQQVIAEFLTQAGYENLEANMNGSAALTSTATTATDNSNKYSMWDDDLFDFDLSCVDTAKSLSSSGTNLNTSGGGGVGSSIKSEQHKYQDDYYFNVLFYAGVPRPLAINYFGFIKLPHAAATTFRKNLLTTRKANNSPISLSGVGGINGVVGGSNVGASAASRLTGINSKSIPNYFTQLSSSGGNPNEFSIGSITITNSQTSTTMSPHQAYAQQQKQQQQGAGSVGGPTEITFNAAHNTNGSATSPVSSVLHRARPKTNAGNSTNALGTNNNIASVGAIGKNKSVMTVTTPGGGVASNMRATIRPNHQQNPTLQQQNTKTIYVSKTANTNSNASNERVKFIKRGLIAKVDIPKSKSKFSPKNIADILGLSISGGGGGAKASSGSIGAGFNKQQHQNSTDNSQDALQAAEEQIKRNRVNRFYERRLALVNNSRQQQQQLKQKLLQKPQLFRNLSDCIVNSSISSHCKNNNNNPNGNNSNDIVRVFV